MLLNAVTKIFYAHITAKYSLNKGALKKKRKHKSSESGS